MYHTCYRFEQLKLDAKVANAQNDAVLEATYAKYEKDKREALAKQEMDLRQDFENLMHTVRDEHGKQLDDLRKQQDEQLHKAEMTFLHQMAKRDLYIHELRYQYQDKLYDYQLTQEKRVLEQEQLWQKQLGIYKQQIVQLKQQVALQQSEHVALLRKEREETVAKQIQLHKAIADVVDAKFQLQTEQTNQKKQVHHQVEQHKLQSALDLIEVKYQHAGQLFAAEEEHRTELAQNHAALTAELGRYIFKKDQEVIKAKVTCLSNIFYNIIVWHRCGGRQFYSVYGWCSTRFNSTN